MCESKPRVLMLASVVSMIMQFNMPNIRLLQSLGYSVDVACNFEYGNTCNKENVKEFAEELKKNGIRFFQIHFDRNPMHVKNLRNAFRQTLTLLRENDYAFMHCHSPIGGAIGRIAAKKTGTRVIYTAHGFHFFRGAPWKNWILYYPVERALSRYTDMLITINREDEEAARRFRAKEVYYLPGIGVDTAKYKKETSELDQRKTKEQFGIPSDSVVLLSVGELSKRKNHAVVLRAINEISCANLHYVIAGIGTEKESLHKLAKQLGLEDRFHTIGFQKDLLSLYQTADVFCFPSLQEGLPVALMEAMASGLPCVVSRIRGNTDLIQEGKGGLLFAPRDHAALAESLNTLLLNPSLRVNMGQDNQQTISAFDVALIESEMLTIYEKVGR